MAAWHKQAAFQQLSRPASNRIDANQDVIAERQWDPHDHCRVARLADRAISALIP
jgi:hypothetical protein